MNSTSTTLLEKYYETLFDPGEKVCVAFNAKGRDVYDIDQILSMKNYEELQYICINPLKERRLDENVTAMRNFLMENDRIPIADQARIVKESGMPYSAAVFSGNKSIHFIISLEDPAHTREYYDFVWLWIYNILCSKVASEEEAFDNKTKNPSRFSRCPLGTNVKLDDDGNEIHRGMQKILQVNGRVSDQALNDWLTAHEKYMPIRKVYDPAIRLSETAKPWFLNRWTVYLLDEGVFEGKRNDEFHRMAYDFYEAGFGLDEALDYVQSHAKNLKDFPRKEIDTCFKSAYKICERRASSSDNH